MPTFSRPVAGMNPLRLRWLLAFVLVGWMSALVALVPPASAAPAGGIIPVSPAGKNAAAPVVAITRQGSIHIAWEQDGGIWYRNWRNGAWSDPQQVAVEGEHPTLAAAPGDETVYLAWAQTFGGNYEIFSRRWDAISGWSAPHNVSGTDGGSSAPALAVSPDGQVNLIWADTSPGVSTLYHAMSSDGVSWPVALAIPDALGSNPTAAFDETGVLHVAWQYRVSFAENLRIWNARYQNDVWSAPVALTDGSQHAYAPDMAANGHRLALAWQEGDQVKLALRKSTGWRIDVTQTGQQPAAAITDDGIIEWAWKTNAGLASQFGLSGWTSPAARTANQSNDLSLTAQNASIGVVWVENQGGDDRVLYKSETLTTIHQPIVMTH